MPIIRAFAIPVSDDECSDETKQCQDQSSVPAPTARPPQFELPKSCQAPGATVTPGQHDSTEAARRIETQAQVLLIVEKVITGAAAAIVVDLASVIGTLTWRLQGESALCL